MKNLISVIMGAYNSEKTIDEALNSLINQTYKNIEIIICDDGSSDKTYEKIIKYKEKYPNMFTVLRNSKNLGLNMTLNKCLKQARGEYVGRMDADDISLPNRFKKQIEFLKTNPEYSFVSSNMIYFDETGDWGVSSVKQKPTKKDFMYNTPFPHAPVLIKKKAFLEVNGYTVNKKLLRVEDYHLWVKLYSKNYKGYNIQEPLYKMRDDKAAYNRRTLRNRINGFYVRLYAIKKLKLPIYAYLFSIRPLVLIFLPRNIYNLLHKLKLRRK